MKKIFKPSSLLNLFPRKTLISISYFLLPLIRLLYKGKKYTDPINGKSYRKFLPYGYGKTRINALSPGTLSLERHRIMWLYLTNETNFFSENLKVLSIAPEQCFLKKFKNLKNIQLITTDLYSPIADVKADIRNLPFECEEFDVVFCNHVLEHIEEDIKAMEELFRVMKKGGWGICQVPFKKNLEKTYEDFSLKSKKERKEHFGQYDHVRWYGMDFFDRLNIVGFKTKKIRYCEKLSDEQIEKFCLNPDEIIPLIYK